MEQNKLREKCPNTELFLVRGVKYVGKRENTAQKKICISIPLILRSLNVSKPRSIMYVRLWYTFILLSLSRCSSLNMFCKKGVLKNFKNFSGKHLHGILFFNNITGLESETLLKKRLWHRYFPVIFYEFLRSPFSRIPGDCFCYLFFFRSNLVLANITTTRL